MGHFSDERTTSGTRHGEWLVNVADDEVVSMTTLEVIDALRKGRVSEESLVWRSGMRNWTAVLEVPQLRLAAGSRPPPAVVASAPPVAPAAEVEPRELAHDIDSTEYVDSPAHFERAERPEPEDSEPVTTLMGEPTQSMIQSSLAPTTAEASTSTRAPGTWGDLDQLLSNERRSEQQHTRRIVLWAALGSAAMAAVFTLFVVRSPGDRESGSAPAEQTSEGLAQPAVTVPASAATLDAPVPASSEAREPAPAVARPAPSAPRHAPRPKRPQPITPGSDKASDPPAAEPAPEATAEKTVTVVPAAPIAPAASPTAPAPTTPAPSAE